MRRSHIRAFTLIELMIVIAIIGILASIIVPNFVRARQEAKLSACGSNLKNVYTAVLMYHTAEERENAKHGHHHEADNESGSITDLEGIEEFIAPEKCVCPTTQSPYYITCAEGGGAHMFTVSCTGNHQSIDIPQGYPQFGCTGSLLMGP